MKYALLLGLMHALLACNAPEKKPGGTDTLAADGTVTDTSIQLDPVAQPAEANTRTFSGFYIYTDKISSLRDCASGQTYWVEDKDGLLKRAYNRYLTKLYPQESIYVQVEGSLAGKSTLGPAAAYANVLHVSKVIRADQKSLRTPCFDFEFLAIGNEPFWSAEIIPAENVIVLKDVAADATILFPYKAPIVSGGRFFYELENEEKQRLSISIRKQSCSNGMSDRQYVYSAELDLNGKKFSGCAIKKGDKIK